MEKKPITQDNMSFFKQENLLVGFL